MEKIKDYSFGIVPVFKETDGSFLFLIIQGKNGAWGFPKGHPEGPEDEITTAKGELLEETGIQNISLLDGVFYSEQYDVFKGGEILNKTVKFFVGFVSDKKATPQEKEITDFKWVKYEEAMDTFVFDGPKRILTKTVEDFKKIGLL